MPELVRPRLVHCNLNDHVAVFIGPQVGVRGPAFHICDFVEHAFHLVEVGPGHKLTSSDFRIVQSPEVRPGLDTG